MRLKNAIRMVMLAIVLLMGTMALPGIASAQVAIGISVGFAPPEVPLYEQPICPGEGYIWTPGYWAWDDDDGDYYWVPGTWVLAPQPGFFWTPGYWGWGGAAFVFYEGYWGPRVGFYGGINYGFGYFGRGYEGGRWEGDRFYYNRTVNNVNVTEIHNVYNTTIVNRNETRVSYNGGNGGINARATSEEQAAARERHIGPVGAQQQHIQAARGNPDLRASANHGKPPIAATQRPGALRGGGVVAARSGGNYNPPPNRGGSNNSRNNRTENNPNRPPNATSGNERNANRPPNASNRAETYSHSRELPQHTSPQPDANANRKYQQEQEKLVQKQNQEHQKLQQQQEKEHQKLEQQQVNTAKQQQTEQRHQQQTQQMEQRHTQQQQKLEQRQEPRQQAPPRQSQQRPPNEKHP